MGQKANPKLLRINISNQWESIWCGTSKSYSIYLLEDFKIRKYLNKELSRAIVSSILINRKSDNIHVDAYVARPGVVFGKKGQDIKLITKGLGTLVNREIFLHIKDIKNTDLDSSAIAQSVSQQLEKRIPFRRAMKQVIQKAMKAGALGIRVSCSGRLGGVEIARRETSMEGSIPLHTFRAIIDSSQSVAHTIYGKCGVKVWVYKGEAKVRKAVSK
eukprot:COSAG01_NODE_1_length_100484_cov_170.446142_85_plen_216_part_00